VLTFFGDLLAGVVNRLDDLPGMAVSVPRLSVWLAAAATALVLYWFVRGHRRDRAAWIATAAMTCWLTAECILHSSLSRGVTLRIDTLALGRAECRLVRAGSSAILWDCGASNPSAGLRTIPRALRELGAFRVRTAVITRADLDHFNAMLDAAEPLGLRQVLVPGTFIHDARSRPGGPAATCLNLLADRGIAVRPVAAGESLSLDGARLDIVSPAPDQTEFQSVADASLIGLISVPAPERELRVLLAASAGRRTIAGLLAAQRLQPDFTALPRARSSRIAGATWLEVRADGRILRSE
jgi:hypothetical protein